MAPAGSAREIQTCSYSSPGGGVSPGLEVVGRVLVVVMGAGVGGMMESSLENPGDHCLDLCLRDQGSSHFVQEAQSVALE